MNISLVRGRNYGGVFRCSAVPTMVRGIGVLAWLFELRILR